MRILFTFLLLNAVLFAQEPSHTIVGDEELEGLVIFSMLQDQRANVWISTSKGLYRYNGYDFKEYTSSEIIGQGLFGLTQDHNQNLYCYNTTGQIFQVEDDSLKLFYTLPDSLFGNFFYIEFDNQNNLLVSAKGIHSIDRKGNLKTLLSNKNFLASPIVRKSDKTVQFYSANGNDLFSYSDQKLTKLRMDLSFSDAGFFYPIFTQKNDYIGVGRSSYLYKRNGNQYEPVNHGIDNPTGCWVFVDNQEDIWVLQNQRGLYLISENSKLSKYSHRLLFSDYTISTKLEDKDGNIWLGTFGKGLIQISNKENQVINNSSLTDNDELKCIAKDNQNNMLIGSVNGKIYQYKNDVLVTKESVPGRIDGIEYNQLSKEFYFKHFAYSQQAGIHDHTPFGSVKNITFTPDSAAILSTYTGVYLKDYSSRPDKHSKDLELMGFTKADDYGYLLPAGRLQCAAYDTKNKTFWVAESSNLRRINITGETEFKYKGKSIVALDMLWIDEELYVATLKHGVLILSNGIVRKTLNTKSGLLSNTITKIKREKKILFLGSNHGLQALDIQTGRFTNFKQANGRQLKVKDFEIVNDVAYIIHHRGIQSVHLKNNRRTISAPILDFTSVVIDNTNRMKENNLMLNHDQNNIHFTFAAKTYNNREYLSYKYRIIGVDNEWKSLNYTENSITLAGLDHGSYELQVYAVDANGQRSNKLTYAFSINQPFWMAWWFYAAIVTLAFVMLILFYRRRLKAQQRKAQQINELNASKLTAIQSQMNPHFIFNSLNSIQDLVIRGDAENSYTFITKFANLVRKTLNYSDKNFIEFEQEVQLIELYLSLEKLRFKANFDFTVNTNNIADILIPPMLIQPFIENALVHGLLHKEGHKQLDISFHLEEHLTCEVVDNGVGRKKAREINIRQNNKHESFAVRAIKTRLEILEEKFGKDIGFHYVDNVEDGQPTGTKVIIKIPVKRLF